jgi:DNA-binding NarL/FixJ family response regulator
MPTVLIVDDSSVVRRALRRILEGDPDWKSCGEADSGEAALLMIEELHPAAVLLDISMPGMGGIQATEAIRAKYPDVKIVVLSLLRSSELVRAIFSAGASGYILKSHADEELIEALNTVASDGTYLSKSVNSLENSDP